MLKFLTFTYKELLKSFLGGRTHNQGINAKFFQSVFEQNPTFGWSFVKVLLKCMLPKETEKETEKDKQKDEDGKGARSNH